MFGKIVKLVVLAALEALFMVALEPFLVAGTTQPYFVPVLVGLLAVIGITAVFVKSVRTVVIWLLLAFILVQVAGWAYNPISIGYYLRGDVIQTSIYSAIEKQQVPVTVSMVVLAPVFVGLATGLMAIIDRTSP